MSFATIKEMKWKPYKGWWSRKLTFPSNIYFFSQKLIAQNCFNHSTWIIYIAQVQALSEFGRHINQSIRYFSASTRNGIIGCCKNFKRKICSIKGFWPWCLFFCDSHCVNISIVILLCHCLKHVSGGVKYFSYFNHILTLRNT